LSCFQANVDTCDDEVSRVRRVTSLLPADTSDDVVRTALLVCADCDMAGQFDLGIDPMIRGLDAYLQSQVT
jgi:hypothetical protein